MNQTNEKDISASVAVVGLAVLVGVLIYFKAPGAVSTALEELDRYAEANLIVLGIILFATTLNCIWVYSVFSRSLGISRQGQRLEILTKQRLRREVGIKKTPWKALLSALVLVPVFYVLLRNFLLTQFPSFLPSRMFVPLAWPIIRWRTGSRTPDLARSQAKVWRKRWAFALGIPRANLR